jgi:hypothetical protein
VGRALPLAPPHFFVTHTIAANCLGRSTASTAAFESQSELQNLSERPDPVLFEAQTTGIFLRSNSSIG